MQNFLQFTLNITHKKKREKVVLLNSELYDFALYHYQFNTLCILANVLSSEIQANISLLQSDSSPYENNSDDQGIL